MTGLARGSSLNVSRRLSPRIGIVVAANALADALRMVVSGVLEHRTDMAAFALIGGRRMLDRLTDCYRAVVTSCTTLWRAFETTIDMARSTVRTAMRTN